MKELKLFNRKVPILAVVMAVLIIGMASAALVSSFMQHDTTVNVSTPVTLGLYNYTFDLVAGENNTDSPISMNITNYANVPTYAGIVTTINSTYGEEDVGPGSGICVYYKVGNTVVTNITVPANNTVELFMHIYTDPGLVPANYTISTNFTPSNLSCVVPAPGSTPQ